MRIRLTFLGLAGLFAAGSLAGCKPPATDEYIERVDLSGREKPSNPPLESPDTEGAVWAESQVPGRIIYGRPGETPLIALACVTEEGESRIRVTRFAPADPRARALFALVGNGHAARVEVDSVWNGQAWLWEGALDAADLRWEVLTGPRAVEATLPGAGMVRVNASDRPRRLIERCRRGEIASEGASVDGQPDRPAPPE